MAVPELALGFHHQLLTTYELFKPVFRTTLSPFVLPRLRHEVIFGPSYSGTVIFFRRKSFTTQGLLHSRGIAASEFLHCAIFPTAASRRSLGRVSVPMWLIILSDQLLIKVLVGRAHQQTNQMQAHPSAHKAFSVKTYEV